MRRCLALGVLVLGWTSVSAQFAVPAGKGNQIKDATPLKPPAGVKVAILEFDDLECPLCAKVLPIVESAAKHYNVPIVHKDLPIWEQHKWALDAAVTARYLHDAVSAKASQDFRRDVFASQTSIANQDDLKKFTQRWFETHKLKLPAVMDPKGIYTNEVKADRDLAMRIGLPGTPMIFVVTPQSWTQVTGYSQLDETVGKAVAETGKR